MEALIEHVLESEIAMPPPRPLRLPVRPAFLLMVAVLLLGLFVAGSGRALWEAAKLAWIGGAGRTVMGVVDDIQTEPSVEKGKPPRQTAVHYTCDIPAPNGVLRRSGWIGVGDDPGAAVPSSAPDHRIGETVPVRYAAWFGGIASHPWQPSPAGRMLSLTLIGGLVLGVSLLLLRRIMFWMRERLRLLRDGLATVGTITHKRTEADDMVRYFLSYGYAPLPGESREGEEQVSSEQWKRFEVGQPVTVLFDPQTPERASLYALMRI